MATDAEAQFDVLAPYRDESAPAQAPLGPMDAAALDLPPGFKPDGASAPPGFAPDEAKPTQEDEDARLGFLLRDALTTQPDEYARTKRLVELTGLAPDVVKGSEKELEDTWAAAKLDPKAWREANPALAKLIHGDPSSAPLVVHDRELSDIAQFFREVKATYDLFTSLDEATSGDSSPQAWKAAEQKYVSAMRPSPERVPMVESPLAKDTSPLRPLKVFLEEYGVTDKGLELASLNFAIMAKKSLGVDTKDLELEAAYLKSQLVPHYYGEGQFTKVMRDVGSLLPSTVRTVEGAGAGGVIGGLAGGTIGAGVALATDNPEAAPALIKKGIGLGLTWGGRAGVAAVSLQLEAGSAYGDSADLKTDDGKPIPEELRRGYAYAYGITATAIELEALPFVLTKLGPLGEALAKGSGKPFLEAALKDPKLSAILVRLGKSIGQGSLAEAGQEGLQQAAQELYGYLARTNAASLARGELALQAPDFSGGLDDIAHTFETTLRGSLGTGAASAIAIQGPQEFLFRDNSLRAANQVKAVVEKGAYSNTVKTSPGTVAALIQSETDRQGAPATHAYVDAKAFERFFQSENADAGAAAEELLGPGGKERLQGALAKGEGGRIEVPMTEYLEKWVPRPIAQALVNDTTTQPGFATANELLAHEEETKAGIQDILKQAEEGKLPAPESEAEKRFTDGLVQQLLNSSIGKARYSLKDAERAADMWRAYLRTQAVKFGELADALFGDYHVTVTSDADGKVSMRLGALEQDAFHGTRARGVERFSLQHVGTGEGAQVYGHGIYFAKRPDVAEGYRKRLTADGDHRERWAVVPEGMKDVGEAYKKLGEEGGYGLASAYQDLTDAASFYRETMKPEEVLGHLKASNQKLLDVQTKEVERQKEYLAQDGLSGEMRATHQRWLQEAEDRVANAKLRLQVLEERKLQALPPKPAGQVYRADVPEDHELLDYDKPLTEQPPDVLARLKNAGHVFEAQGKLWAFTSDPADKVTGERLYEALAQHLGSPQAASSALRVDGIPGMRYLDQGSRAAGRGTHNFVVWDESRMPIQETYYQDGAEPGPLWFSAVEKAVEGAKQQKGDAKSWLAVISKTPGVKKEELDVLGLQEWLASREDATKQGVLEGVAPKPSRIITKQEIQDFIRAHRVEVTEKLKGDGASADAAVDVERLMDRYGIAVTQDGVGAYEFEYQVDVEHDVELRTAEDIIQYLCEQGDIDTGTADGLEQDMAELLGLLDNPAEQDEGDSDEDFQARQKAEGERVDHLVEAIESHGIHVNTAVSSPFLYYGTDYYEQETLTRPRDIAKALRKSHGLQGADEARAIMDRLINRQETDAEYEGHTIGGHKPGSYRELLFHSPMAEGYNAPHFEESKNLLAHARFSEHRLKPEEGKTVRGKPVFVIEEIQSDLHQKARKLGYADPKAMAAQLRLEKAEKAVVEALNNSVRIDQAKDAALDIATGRLPGLGMNTALTEALKAMGEEKAKELREAFLERGKTGEPEGLPSAPFKASWEEMVAKRLLRYAAENGYDKVAWTTGDTQNERYGLEKHIERLEYNPASQRLTYWRKGRFWTSNVEGVTPERLPEYVGDETAKKLLATKPHGFSSKSILGDDGSEHWIVANEHGRPVSSRGVQADGDRVLAANVDNKAEAELLAERLNNTHGGGHILEGLDLKVGGEGMRFAYDKKLPGIIEKLVKKHGGKVGKATLDTGTEVHVVELPEAFREQVVREGMPLFQKDDGAGPRGFVQFAREGAKRLAQVVLRPKADMSTFLHESGHVFLDMAQTLAAREDAPESVKADWQALREYLGLAEGQAIEAQHHEKFARTFEAYLYEGKAPSNALVRAFTRFKLWLRAVYQNLRALDVPLNDEIRGVLDRMFATDDEIAAASGRAGLTPVFRSPEEAGMSADEWQAYQEAQEKTFSHATMAATHRVVKEQLRETEDWWRAELKKKESEAALEYEAKAEVRALRYLESQEGNTEPVRLDGFSVEAAIGPDAARALKRFLVAEGGVTPDALAEALGMETTGRQLLLAMSAVEEKDAYVQRTAEAAMRAAHPDILEDKAKLSEVAQKGLHGDFSQQWLLREYVALRAKAGQDGAGAPPAQSFREAARLLVERERVGALSPARVLQAERSASEKAFKAAAKEDWPLALIHKQQQVLHHFLYRHTLEAREEADAGEELAARASKDTARARVGKASPLYRDALDAIIEGVGLAEERPREVPLPTLDAVAQAMELQGHTVAFDASVVQPLLGRVHWKNLTVGQMREVVAALKNIRKAASNLATVLKDGKRVEKEAEVERLLADADKNVPDRKQVASSVPAMSLIQKGASTLSALHGEMLRPELMLGWLAGDNLESSWMRSIVAPLQKAKAHEKDLLRTTIAPLLKAFDAIPERMRRRLMERVDGDTLFPQHRKDIAAPSRRFELIVMALNRGNEGNLQRLTEGRDITVEQVDRALGALEKEEWEWVQACWTAAESLWPLARALEERDSGVAPPKVVATPVATRFGTFTGGYWPLAYDRRVSSVGERQASEQAIASIFDPTYTRPGTSHGHLKSRVPKLLSAVALDPSVISAHLAKVVHDIAFREPLKSVASLVLDPRVEASIKQHLGEDRARLMRTWLKDIGQLRGSEVATHALTFNRTFSALKSNTVQGVMAYNFKVAIGNLVNGLTAAVSTKLKSRYYLQAQVELLTKPSLRDFALEKSGELRAMDEKSDKQLSQRIARMTSRVPTARAAFDAYLEFGYLAGDVVDKLVLTPVWLGSYRQALEEGLPEERALEFADGIVRSVTSAKSDVDRSEVMRSKGAVGVGLMLFGYFNTSYNLRTNILHNIRMDFVRDGKGTRRLAGRLAALVGLAGALALGDALTRGGPDDDEDKADYIRRRLLWNGLGLGDLPFIGAALEPLMSDKPVSERGQPGVSTLVLGLKAGKRVRDEYMREGEVSEKALWDALAAGGKLAGVPVQPAVMGRYVLKALEGEEPATPEGLRRLIYKPGPQREER